jgi:hypothetical protein
MKNQDDYTDLICQTVLSEGHKGTEKIELEYQKRLALLPAAARAMIDDAIKYAKKDHRTSAELNKILFDD